MSDTTDQKEDVPQETPTTLEDRPVDLGPKNSDEPKVATLQGVYIISIDGSPAHFAVDRAESTFA